MTGWVVETLVGTTLLMLLVLAIRPWIADRFGARAAYLLWLAPALRMVLPPLPAEWLAAGVTPVKDVVVVLTGTSSHPVATAAATGGGIAWLTISLMVWLGGAALFFARHWLDYMRFAQIVHRDGEALFDVEAIPVTASPSVASPIALGVFGKSVIVPTDFVHRYDADEQRLAMAHEIVHHRRLDVLTNFAALAMLALHWFNPIAHIAHRAFRLDQEAACDAVVLDGASADERHAYGSALFKSAMGSVPLAACAMGATTTLKARLRRIVAGPVNGRLARPGLVIVTAFVAGGVALTASGSVAETITAKDAAPRAVVLGGGIIEAGEETALRGQIEADIAKAEADAARIEARKALAGAEKDARKAEKAAKMVALAPLPPPPPSPPVVPNAPSPQSFAEVTPPTTPLAPAVAHCSGEGRIRVALSSSTDGVSEHRAMRILVCNGGRAANRAIALEALKSARQSIAVEMMLSDDQRSRALDALDKQIAQLASAPAPHPGFSLQ
jgi:bla regulator protein blaR1